jgi:hypothetical protein
MLLMYIEKNDDPKRILEVRVFQITLITVIYNALQFKHEKLRRKQ